MAKDYVFSPPPNWPPPPRGWTPPPGWTPDPAWGPAPEGWEFWTLPESGGSWIARHTVLTGVGATVAVLGTVFGISAFTNGSDDPAPVAAATTASLLTAVEDTTGPSSLPEQTLSSSRTESPSQTTSTTSRPTSSTSTTTTSPSPTSTTTTPSPTKTARVYVSCRGMNRDHPHGVGLPGAKDEPRPGQQEVKDFTVNARLYLANQFLDRDGDGVACER